MTWPFENDTSAITKNRSGWADEETKSKIASLAVTIAKSAALETLKLVPGTSKV